MAIGQSRIAPSRTIGSQSVGDDGVGVGVSVGHVPLPFQQFPHELESRPLVPPRLYEKVEHLVVDGAPGMMNLAADPDEHLIEMPAIRGPWPALADLLGICAAELERPPAHRLVRGIDATLGEQILDVAMAQRKPEVEPDGMLDDPGREAVTGAGRFARAAQYAAGRINATRLM